MMDGGRVVVLCVAAKLTKLSYRHCKTAETPTPRLCFDDRPKLHALFLATAPPSPTTQSTPQQLRCNIYHAILNQLLRLGPRMIF